MRQSDNTEETISDDYASRQNKCQRNCLRCRRYTCNRAEGTCCGRTFRGWTQILFYYIFFILLVYVYFSISLHFVGSRDTSGESKFNKDDMIYPAPGASMFPSDLDNTANNMVWLPSNNNDKAKKYTNKIENFLNDLEETCDESKFAMNLCSFNRKQLGPCGKPDFGFKAKKPCIYLKLNKQNNFKPKAYGSEKNIPSHVPKEFRKTINATRKVVWVHCFGRSDYDKDHLGKIKYHPEPAFNEANFPMVAKLPNPVIALELASVDPGYILRLRCQLYAKDLPNALNFQENSFVYIE